jgi:hypothetical protein
MASVGAIAAGMPSVDGYPNRPDRELWVMLAYTTGMDLFIVAMFWWAMGPSALPAILFVLGCTVMFCYLNLKARYLRAPVRVAVGPNGLRFMYRDGAEEDVGWERIAAVHERFGNRSGASVVEVVDRMVPVSVPLEVVRVAAPLLEEAERRAERMSTLSTADPGTKAAKRALRSWNVTRTLLVLVAVALPFIALLVVSMTFWA